MWSEHYGYVVAAMQRDKGAAGETPNSPPMYVTWRVADLAALHAAGRLPYELPTAERTAWRKEPCGACGEPCWIYRTNDHGRMVICWRCETER